METASNDLKSHPAGDESERQNLNASSQDSRQYAANVEHPSIDVYADDVCLITETITPSSGSSDHNRSDKSKGSIWVDYSHDKPSSYKASSSMSLIMFKRKCLIV